MLKRREIQILVGLAIVALIYLIINREHLTIEHLTGNAPKELPLPSELKRSDMTPVSEKDKAKLDTREIPTGFSSESDYLLSPQTIQAMQKPTTPETQKSMTEQEKKDKIKELERQLEELKKTTQ